MDWSEWLQDAGSGLLKAGTDIYKTKTATNAQIQIANASNLTQLQGLQMQMQYGSTGLPYAEGRPNISGATGIPPMWLLIGGIALVVVMVKN